MEPLFDMWPHSDGCSPGNMSRKRELSLLPYLPLRQDFKMCRDIINSISFLSEVNVKSRVVVYGAAF